MFCGEKDEVSGTGTASGEVKGTHLVDQDRVKLVLSLPSRRIPHWKRLATREGLAERRLEDGERVARRGWCGCTGLPRLRRICVWHWRLSLRRWRRSEARDEEERVGMADELARVALLRVRVGQYESLERK